jgi:hypothetical protein
MSYVHVKYNVSGYFGLDIWMLNLYKHEREAKTRCRRDCWLATNSLI